jgi:hypothetical protein
LTLSVSLVRTAPRVAWFRVHAVNHEGIPNRGAFAFARVEWRRK